jgi:hypothetical protein
VVIIEHLLGRETVATVMGHLRSSGLNVSVGQFVTKGYLLGYLGNSFENGGYAPHAHYGINKGNYSGDFAISCDGKWVYAGYANYPNACVQSDWYDPTDFNQVHQTLRTHPNGTVVQVPSGGVYVLHSGMKRHVDSSLAFNSWYESSEIVPVSDSELAQYAECCPVGYRSGKLVQDRDTYKVYFITNENPYNPAIPEYFLGRLRWVTSPQILADCFPGNPVIWDENRTLTVHRPQGLEGPPISTKCSQTGTYGTHPNGTPVIYSSSVYILESGSKRPLIGAAVSTWLFWPDVVGISLNEGNSYPTGGTAGFRPGRLIQNSSGAIYSVTNDGNFALANKRHVADPFTLACLYPGESWTPVLDADANLHPSGAPVQVSVC